MPNKAILSYLSLSALAVTIAVGSSAVGEEIELDIQYIAEAGDTYDFIATASNRESSKTLVDGQVFEESQVSSTITMEGRLEFLAVDEDGVFTRVAYRLDAVEAEIDGEVLEIDRSRRLIMDLSSDELLLSYEDGGAIDAELRDLIISAVDVPEGVSEESDDDEGEYAAFLHAVGLDRPRAPGTRWDMDYEAFLAHGEGEAFPFDLAEETTSAGVRFTELNQATYGEDVAFLIFEVDSSEFEFVDPQIPEHFETGHSVLGVEMVGQFALDPRSYVGMKSFEMAIEFTTEGDVEDRGQTFRLRVEATLLLQQSMTLTRPE